MAIWNSPSQTIIIDSLLPSIALLEFCQKRFVKHIGRHNEYITLIFEISVEVASIVGKCPIFDKIGIFVD
jgi:hypothetical protein